MKQKIASGLMLALLICILTLVFDVQPVCASLQVHNVDTGEDFAGIQDAIDDSDTLDGHTILVGAGTYYEDIVVDKSVSLIGENKTTTIIDGAGAIQALVEIVADHVSIAGFTIKNADGQDILVQGRTGTKITGNIISNARSWGICLGWGSQYSIISHNTIVNNYHIGMQFAYSGESNLISNNEFVFNGYGFLMVDSGANIIRENNFTSNWRGLEIGGHAGLSLPPNHIYHNNFRDNSIQAITLDFPNNVWDDDYPSGGNYWSDYEDRYPDATEIDESGVWDTAYVIDENNQDSFPLMEPWSPLPRNIDELKTEMEELGSQGEIDNQGVVRSLVAKLNVAQRLVDKGKIEEAKGILEDDFIPQIQNLAGIHITVEAAALLMESVEYIIAHL